MDQPSQPNPVVIYHASCFDGFTAAWVYWRYFPGGANALFLPAAYGEEPPFATCRGRDVLVFDFSWKRADMLTLAEVARSLRVYDHHVTAQDELEGLPWAVFDMERSGAGIVWDELVGPALKLHEAAAAQARPALVRYVEDRDLWRLKLPLSREVTAWIATQEMSFDAWSRLALDVEVGEAATRGSAVLAYIRNYGRKASDHAAYRTIAGYIVPTMNLSYQNCSEHLETLHQRFPDAPFVASFFLRKDGQWQFSLRSKAPFNVADVAKVYGGGGHAQAAGFQVTDLDQMGW